MTRTFELEVVTPCFCAGANQARAEIRVPSIRGELRWWFRVLGGTQDQEADVFGGVHGGAAASKVVVRIRDYKPGDQWTPPRVDPNATVSYIYYFASKSGDGCRWSREGNVPPGSVFTLDILLRRQLNGESALFEKALKAFLVFGALGLRQTRGLGSLSCKQLEGDLDALKKMSDQLLKHDGFGVLWLDRKFTSWPAAIEFAGGLLKFVLRKEYNSKRKPKSPLGYSERRDRQASAVQFRVKKLSEGDYRLLLFEAPHDKVLGQDCRSSPPVLHQLHAQIIGYNGAPSPNPVRRRY